MVGGELLPPGVGEIATAAHRRQEGLFYPQQLARLIQPPRNPTIATILG
jgi:hypothetical protein